MVPGLEWSPGTIPEPHLSAALCSLQAQSNKSNVCGNNTMDFPSTYGLSLSSMTQEQGPAAATAQTWKD